MNLERLTKKSVFSFYALAVGCLVLLGLFAAFDKGHKWRIKANLTEAKSQWHVKARKPRQNAISNQIATSGKFFKTGVFIGSNGHNRKALVIGDSHVGRFDEFLFYAARELKTDFYVAWSPCWIGLPNLRSVRSDMIGKKKAGKCAQPQSFWSLWRKQILMPSFMLEGIQLT